MESSDPKPFDCPRCGVKLPRQAMTVHLWERHRRLLVGRRVRRPWRLIDRWMRSGGGRLAAHRRLLRMGGANDGSLAALRLDARERRAGLCPRCYGSVQLDPRVFPSPDDVPPLTLSHGRLAGSGFVVEIVATIIGPRLRIETQSGLLFDGPEPRAPQRPRGRWLPAIPVVFALLLSFVMPPAIVLASTLVALYVAVALAMGLRRFEADDRPDRLIDHAWRLLVPQLTGDDNRFLAALAISSCGHGDPRRRAATLDRVTTNSVGRSGGPQDAALTIALQRLRIADADDIEGDPSVVLADAVEACFTGRLTPAAVEHFLTDEILAPVKERSEFARLRILIVARVFAAGFGVWDLHALGQALPRLGRLLNADDTDGLARLRMLWDERSARPWRQCGPAATVFELVNYPMLGGQHLQAAPDLLLFQPLPAGGDPVHLLACGRGLIIGGALMHDWPTRITSKPLPESKGGGYEVLFGAHSVQVRGNVDELVQKLTRWAEYFFMEFLPWIGNALTRPGDGAADRLTPLTVRCPTCRINFVGRRGDVGRRGFAQTSRPHVPDST
jgi:hypothetical protein